MRIYHHSPFMILELLSNKRLVRDLLFEIYYKDLCKRIEVLVY